MIALTAAWAVVLVAMAGAAAYLLLQGSPQPAAPAPTMVLELPPVQGPSSVQVPLLDEEPAPDEQESAGNGDQAEPQVDPAPADAAQAATTPDSDAPGQEAGDEGEIQSAETQLPEAQSPASDVAAAEEPAPSQALPTAPERPQSDAEPQDEPPTVQADAEPQDEPPTVQADAEPQDEPPQAPEALAETTAEAAETTAEAEPAAEQQARTTQGGDEQSGGQAASAEVAHALALPADEQQPWRQFAANFDEAKGGPRIAVVLFGLGLSAAATEAAIKQLPPEVTLSFSPYARLLEQWIALARANGHEVMLDLPLEPLTFPEDDPGPHALLTVLDEEQNEKRLDWLLRRATSYVGVTAVMGSRFSASSEHMMPLLKSLKGRGLLFLDNRASEQSAALTLSEKLDLPFVANDRTLDAAQASRVAINARLSEIERIARENGFAVALAQPYPVTIERLRDWATDVESRGFALAPVTVLAGASP